MESAYRRRNLFDDSDEEETAQGKQVNHFWNPNVEYKPSAGPVSEPEPVKEVSKPSPVVAASRKLMDDDEEEEYNPYATA